MVLMLCLKQWKCLNIMHMIYHFKANGTPMSEKIFSETVDSACSNFLLLQSTAELAHWCSTIRRLFPTLQFTPRVFDRVEVEAQCR